MKRGTQGKRAGNTPLMTCHGAGPQVYYSSTCTAFVQLNKRLRSKGLEDPTLKKLAGTSHVEDFCKDADALMDAR